MAPALLKHIRDAVTASSTNLEARSADKVLETRKRFVPTVDPKSGVLDPHDINNAGFFVLFALIGVGFVVGGIWFFFWAKNGGFYFAPERDWDDYKSTVLRRTGPNGTILSNVTKTTKLGGGSVYKDVEDDGHTVVTESTALSGITAGASDVYAREKRKRKEERRERERAKKRGDKHSKRHVGEHGILDEEAEKAAKEELRNYRHERPARVGGLNKESEGSQWDGSTIPSESTVASDLSSARQSAAPSSSAPSTSVPSSALAKYKKPGIRKVDSVADRREADRARREKERAARRDFSWQRAESSISESLLEGNSSDLGTKSYHHPMPELRQLEREKREKRERDREERRARRGGYRRGRGEDYVEEE